MKKVLLLTNIPPCTVDAGGLTLEQLCRFFPRDSLACFAVVHPYWLPRITIAPDLADMPLHCEPEPPFHVPARALRRFSSILLEGHSFLRIRQLVRRAVSFGRTVGAEILWCHLAGQTMIRMALPASRALDIPLLSQVFDPPDFWFRIENVPNLSRAFLANAFRRTLQASLSVSAISWDMAEEYRQAYGARTVTVLPGHDRRLAHTPVQKMRSDDEMIIGVAGNLHDRMVWDSFIAALQSSDWSTSGRKVRIRLLGRSAPFDTSGRVVVEFLGWQPTQEDAIRLLAETDVLYCPFWFDESYDAEARLSFPSKLTTYLAAGRPILFHGPEHAPVARFLREQQAALCCTSLEAADILDALGRIASDAVLYAKLAANGRAAFERHLTTEIMRASFAEFLGIGEEMLVSPERQAV